MLTTMTFSFNTFVFCVLWYLYFLKIDFLRESEYIQAGREGDRESQADPRSPAEPDVGLNLTTLTYDLGRNQESHT